MTSAITSVYYVKSCLLDLILQDLSFAAQVGTAAGHQHDVNRWLLLCMALTLSAIQEVWRL